MQANPSFNYLTLYSLHFSFASSHLIHPPHHHHRRPPLAADTMQETTTHHYHHHVSFALLLILILFLLLPTTTTADIKTVKITDDSREMIEFEEFGFTKTGHISISISSVSVTTTNATTAESPTNSSAFGFFIAPITTQVSPDICILNNPQITIISTLAGLAPPPQSSLHKTINVTKPDNYVVVFANCVTQTSVSMIVHFESYNLDSNGKKDYLPDGETQLPALFFTLSICYIPFLIIWIRLCQKNKPFVNKIHILMALLLAMKALNLLFAAEDKYHVKTTGTPRGWELLFYTFRSIRALLLFTVTVLIGTGWSFLKPFLQDKEKNILMFGIPLQLFVNIAFIMMEESGPSAKNYEFWLTGFAFVDIICCFVIMIPVTWSIRTLRETSKLDGRAATNLKKLRLFRDFYIALVVYTYFTRYSIYFLRLYFDYKNQWFCQAIVETATLGFYIVMYYLFQPQERNQYFALSLDDKEEEAALTAIQSAEFADY